MKLKLTQIVTTAGTQIRAAINEDVVAQYASDMVNGDQFPTIVVFHDGSQYILSDGFHRVLAAARNDFLDIEADVRKGSRQDALKHALTANCSHGLRRTNADKRRSVELALEEWPNTSSRELAKMCGVSDMFVGTVRDQLQTDCSCRIGADGKERKLPVKSEAAKSEPVDIKRAESQNLFPRSESGVTFIEPEKPPMEDYRDQGQKRDLDLACIKSNIEATVTNVIHYAPKGELAAFKLFLEREASRVGMANRQHRAEMASQEKES